jgi:hypothetical protein
MESEPRSEGVKADRPMGDSEPKLKEAAERVGGGPVLFEGFFPVLIAGNNDWKGVVHQFTCDRGRVYAWATNGGDKEPAYIAVLQKPPVDSPLSAVRAWLTLKRANG